jgi:hypothetical protein
MIVISAFSQSDTIVSSQKITSKNINLATKSIENDSSIYPRGYPKFLRTIFTTFKKTEEFRQLSPAERENFMNNVPEDAKYLFRATLKEDELNIKNLLSYCKKHAGEEHYQKFLNIFGLDSLNYTDIELEINAQINRMKRRQRSVIFRDTFASSNSDLETRINLIKKTSTPVDIEYALSHCSIEEFDTLCHVLMAQENFGPQTSVDFVLLEYILKKRRDSLDKNNREASQKWRSVFAQLISQPVGNQYDRLDLSKPEVFAMLRNTERTLQQRKRPFIDITSAQQFEADELSHVQQILNKNNVEYMSSSKARVLLFALFDEKIDSELIQLRSIYKDIISYKFNAQSVATLASISDKRNLIETICDPAQKSEMAVRDLSELVNKILVQKDQVYRSRFIRGIVILKAKNGNLEYRLIEDYPMIVAGDSYPYQWKHDNEVNIALLLANIDPYQAAQAVRFIIYHGMWRGEYAREIELYGWLPQIIFGNRQTGKMPVFENKIYYYCPDFRLRPTSRIDAENERNRTSEIMQLPFFGWTVWCVYEELNRINSDHAKDFLKEVYPYVRANTEAIRTALDPYDEGVLSGRDAWVNGMDNAWYHQVVMYKHLPERFIPARAGRWLDQYRVDNRIGKKPGNPVDPELAKGRPSDYYYSFKLIFYDIANRLELDPFLVYHATPYNAKDVAITGVMARSIEAQIAMANVLKQIASSIDKMCSLREQEDELVKSWDDEIYRYQTYLDKMKRSVNKYMWHKEEKMYYNRDVTNIFSNVVEQQLCRLDYDEKKDLAINPTWEYWDYLTTEKNEGYYSLNQKGISYWSFDSLHYPVIFNTTGHMECKEPEFTQYWIWIDNKENKGYFQLNIDPGDPFIIEQFCHVSRDKNGKIIYRPDWKYWVKVKDQAGVEYLKLNDKAKSLLNEGARNIIDGDLINSPGIAGFFPLFGRIPDSAKAFQLAQQVINPWLWWPINGIPIPTQPMNLVTSDQKYTANNVYNPDKYWCGPTWMASEKPVIDGFYSYGYQMIYLYLVRKTISTLQDGRAVEHWNPETGLVNTSNKNFPWSASCMAGSIWQEMTKEAKDEYLQIFHQN